MALPRRWFQGVDASPARVVPPAPVRWRERWAQLLEWLGLPPVYLGVGERLLSCYRAPGRHFHGVTRVLGCLRELDRYPGAIGSPDEVELAVWFHGAVWDPVAPPDSNQLESARWFQREFGDLAAQLVDSELVRSLIAAVGGGTGARARDRDHLLAGDIGCAWLGADPVRYGVHCSELRRETAHEDDSAWARHRLGAVRRLLGEEWVFRTRHYRQTSENQARENLLKEFERLGAVG